MAVDKEAIFLSRVIMLCEAMDNDPGKSPGYTVCDCSVGCCQLGILQFTLGCRTVHALLHGVHSAGDCHGDEHVCWPVYAEPTKDRGTH